MAIGILPETSYAGVYARSPEVGDCGLCGPKNGFCTVFWQIVDKPKEPMELPAPVYDLGYPALLGHSFQVVSKYRP
jgi:hypothetical protein